MHAIGRDYFNFHFLVHSWNDSSNKGVSRRDDNNQVMPELGFSVSMIPQGTVSGFVLRIHCGCYSPWAPNCCSLAFPREGEIVDRLIWESNLVRLAKTIVQNWHPEYGVITSHQCSDLLSPTSFEQEVGWITYLPKQFGEIPPLSNYIKIEEAGDGHLLIINKERFSARTPAMWRPYSA